MAAPVAVSTSTVVSMPSAKAPVEEPRGPKILLIGDSGSGKTHAIRSLCEEVEQVFALFTEPGFESLLGDIPPEKLKWRYVAPGAAGWEVLLDIVKKVNTMSTSALTQIGSPDKAKFTEFQDIITSCANFTCQRSGEPCGDISKFTNRQAFVLDSWSGLGVMAMNMAAGSKPIREMAEWGMTQDYMSRLLLRWNTALRCAFLMTAHPEMEGDELSGGARKLMASTPGRKLAPQVPRYFDDVVYARRELDSNKRPVWQWSTITNNATVKGRNLPMQDNLSPDFKLLFKNWRAKTGVR